jgi:hypothetical protein
MFIKVLLDQLSKVDKSRRILAGQSLPSVRMMLFDKKIYPTSFLYRDYLICNRSKGMRLIEQSERFVYLYEIHPNT